MPVWASVVIGLGSGVIGTFATIVYQRTAARGARRLDAAAAFLAAADDFRRTVRTQQKPSIEEAVQTIVDAWDGLVTKVSLVRLLFGWDSAVAQSAVAAAGAFEEVKRRYVESGAPEQWLDEEGQRVDELMTMADEYMRWFAERAGGGVVRKRRLRRQMRDAEKSVQRAADDD